MELTFGTMERRVSGWAKVPLMLGAVGLLLPACLRTEEFPPEPRITFKAFDLVGDSASIVITFTDGDGDVGLNPGDTFPPYAPGTPNYSNLRLEYQELRNGSWTPVTFPQPLVYRVPNLTPTGQNKALEGEIAIALAPFSLYHYDTFDTVRYKVQLLDRALNISNQVETTPIVLP